MSCYRLNLPKSAETKKGRQGNEEWERERERKREKLTLKLVPEPSKQRLVSCGPVTYGLPGVPNRNRSVSNSISER